MSKKMEIPRHIKTKKGQLNYLRSAIVNKKYKLERIGKEAHDTKAEITGIIKQIAELQEKVRVVA